ncbi:Biopterin transport-related protein BT1 [Coccomyxa subellipsoidea C-169]|uniref:Biopterin transport-related protein BT1 n=1 Tax=Coccomyxa subellipsoidea (strain C-169) TaxID=574566 RepID=I0Z8M8_COCSC|nr:Biopterin transport-related protein BT1 [Coccomyxa subellipsoidea C-169]EIE26997.1 Biopterin transport-related protein BT1 [Coccomyxa subellipsoidea C-169]|eukprot:XP_005651541.1 Biopterin transport-related protein BT1 [Coccomyxa subellipsoidea C-169]
MCRFLAVYMVFGFLDVWGRLPVNFFLKDDLHWSPSQQLEFWGGIKALPWVIKPVYGLLSDAVPLLGYHRRSYLILFSLMGIGVWVGFSRVQDTPQAIAALMLASFSEAFSITVVDSILVMRTHGQSQDFAASLQSFCWGLQAVGKVVSAAVVGIMVHQFTPRNCMLVVAALPVFVLLCSFVMREERKPIFGEAAAVLAEKMTLLRDTCCDKYLLLPALFLFLWQITPSVDSAMFYFSTNALHFSEEFFGIILLVDGVCQVLGVAFYNVFLRSVAIKKVFFWSAMILIAVHAAQAILVTGSNRTLGISDGAFALVVGGIHAGVGRLAMMPLVTLAARLCPKGVEATVFGMLMSLHISSFMLGKVFGSALTKAFGVTSGNFANLANLVLVCAVARFLPLPLLCLLPDKLNQAEEEEARRGDTETAEARIGVAAKEGSPLDGGTNQLSPKA